MSHHDIRHPGPARTLKSSTAGLILQPAPTIKPISIFTPAFPLPRMSGSPYFSSQNSASPSSRAIKPFQTEVLHLLPSQTTVSRLRPLKVPLGQALTGGHLALRGQKDSSGQFVVLA